jgi:hypothetical protein
MKAAKYFLTVVVIGGLFLLAPVSTTYGDRQALLPTIPEGTIWQFKSSTTFPSAVSNASEHNVAYEVIYQKDKLRVFILGQNIRTEIEDTRADELRRLVAAEEDGRNYLHFPLFVGKRWNAVHPVRLPGGKFAMRRNVGYAKAIEHIQTAAGNFEAFRIDGWISGNAWLDGTYSGPYTLFYSPQTGSILKLSYESKIVSGSANVRHEIELVKFAMGTAEYDPR